MPDLMIVDDEAPSHSAAGGRPWRVLVVDDEPCLQDVHRRLLGKLGVEVLVAASGGEARRLIRSELLDVVISDVNMPGELNGIMLFKWLATERSQLAERFIFVTGDTHDLVLPSLREGRPSRLLTKPFRMQEYLAQVSALLDGIQPGFPGPLPAAA